MKKPQQNNPKWPFTLQGKFILVASLCIVIFSLVGNLIVVSREENLYKKEMVNQCRVIAEISRVTLTNVMVFNEMGMINRLDLIDYFDYFIMNLMTQDKRIRNITILDEGGSVLAKSNIDESGMDVQLWKSQSQLSETKITEGKFGKENIYQIAIPLNIKTKYWGMMLIGISLDDMYKNIASHKKEVLWVVVMLSSLSLLVVSIGSKIVSGPIVHLAEIMDNIKTHGDLKQHNIEFEERRDELGKLQKSLEWMMRRLKDADMEREKTMEVLLQTEKMVSVGRLASGVAHEINNPLGGIAICFNNLMKPGMDEETRKEHVELINDCLQRIKKIVGHLLDFSKSTVTEKSLTNLNDLLERQLLLIKYSAEGKAITIVRDFGGNLPDISVDRAKLGQVFLNMFLNAINAMQAMDNGGLLTIRTRQTDGFYEVQIRDTGTGIPSEIMSEIFDPFFTTKAVGIGTGLGLSVSKSIIEQHGGVIEVESEVGVGTAFRVRLPVEQG